MSVLCAVECETEELDKCEVVFIGNPSVGEAVRAATASAAMMKNRFMTITIICFIYLNDELREQLFAFVLCDASAAAVVAELVTVDAAHGEVTGFGVEDEETADGSGGLDAVVVGQGDVHPLLCFQEVEDDALQGVVGTGCVAEGDSQS